MDPRVSGRARLQKWASPAGHRSVAQCDTHHFVEVMRQVGPLRVVEDAVVSAPGPTGLGHHAQHAELAGHLQQQGSLRD